MIMVQRSWLEIVWRSVLVPLQQFTVVASRKYSKVKGQTDDTFTALKSTRHAVMR